MQWATHVGAEAKALRHLGRGQAVGPQAALDRLAAGDDKVPSEADPVQRGTACPHVAKHEAEHGQPRQVDMEAVAPEGDVVTEPGPHLRCVRHATDPRECGHVIQGTPVVEFDAQVIPQTGGDDP